MTRGTLLFLVVVVSGVSLPVLIFMVFTELRQVFAFDRRLAVPRGQALAAAPRSDTGRRGSGDLPLRAAGLALFQAGSMLVPVGAGDREKLTAQLRHAGFDQRDALAVFLSMKLFGAVAASAGGGVWALQTGQHGLLVVFAVLGGLVVGSIAPEYVLRSLKNRRSRRISAVLPDALDLMVLVLEAGLTFERALLTVADELTPIEPNLADELRTLEAELRLGGSRRAVLQDFQQRTDVEGLRTPRPDPASERSLRHAAHAVDAEHRAQRTDHAGRGNADPGGAAAVLMTLPMLLFVVPGTMLLVAGPAFLSVTRTLGSLGG